MLNQISNNLRNVLIYFIGNIYENSNTGNNSIIRTRKVIKNKSQLFVSYRFYLVSKLQNNFFVFLAFLSLFSLVYFKFNRTCIALQYWTSILILYLYLLVSHNIILVIILPIIIELQYRIAAYLLISKCSDMEYLI